MATLNQIHLPDELLSAIKRRAAAQGIGVEEQIIRDLASAENATTADEHTLLERIRCEREALAAKGIFLTDEILAEAKSWGRE